MGPLVPAAQQTLRAQCYSRSGCGRCAACRVVLAAARRVPPERPTVAEEVPRPSVRAAKSVWVDYAVARAMDRGTAEGMAKAALVEMLS